MSAPATAPPATDATPALEARIAGLEALLQRTHDRLAELGVATVALEARLAAVQETLGAQMVEPPMPPELPQEFLDYLKTPNLPPKRTREENMEIRRAKRAAMEQAARELDAA